MPVCWGYNRLLNIPLTNQYFAFINPAGGLLFAAIDRLEVEFDAALFAVHFDWAQVIVFWPDVGVG